MLKKHGSYFADWRDKNGVRHRRAFPTAQEAREFQIAMRLRRESREERPKTSPQLQPSPTRLGSGWQRKPAIRIRRPRSPRY
jgi:hypothetical protein